MTEPTPDAPEPGGDTATPSTPAVGASANEPTSSEPTDNGPTDGAPSAPSPRPSRLPWVLVALLAITTLVSTVGWMGSTGGDEAGREVRGAAITFVTELTNWDATDGLDDTVATLRELGTGDFLTQIDEVLGDEARATAEAVGAVSRGEIVEVLVSDVEDDRAVAIVIVEQELTVAGESAIQEQVSRIEFVLVEGEWLVTRSELLNAPTLGAGPGGQP